MEKYIYDEKNGIWYELHGGYYLPCLTLPVEEERARQIWDITMISDSKCFYSIFLSYYLILESFLDYTAGQTGQTYHATPQLFHFSYIFF